MLMPLTRAVALFLLALTASREAAAQTLTIKVAPGTKITIIRDPAKAGSDNSSHRNAGRGADYVPPGQVEKTRRERAERDKEWQARCRPETYTDKDGVTRYRYAQRGCDVQVLN